MKIKTFELDCECFEDLAIKQNIKILETIEIDNNTNNYKFVRQDGSIGWANETSSIYATDGYVSKIIIYDAPDYCTQNNGDCFTCSLVNYKRDCQNNLVEG